MVIDTSEFRKGMKIELDGEVYEIIDFQHARTAQRRAFVRTKLKNISTNSIREHTFSAGEKLTIPEFEEKPMQFLYKAEKEYTFMDLKSYEQIVLTEAEIGESKWFLQENMELTVQFHEKKPIGIKLPIAVEFEVVETEPDFKGDTVSGGGKPARIETGYVVKVPYFIEVGHRIKIDTRTGEYIERVK